MVEAQVNTAVQVRQKPTYASGKEAGAAIRGCFKKDNISGSFREAEEMVRGMVSEGHVPGYFIASSAQSRSILEQIRGKREDCIPGITERSQFQHLEALSESVRDDANETSVVIMNGQKRDNQLNHPMALPFGQMVAEKFEVAIKAINDGTEIARIYYPNGQIWGKTPDQWIEPFMQIIYGLAKAVESHWKGQEAGQ